MVCLAFAGSFVAGVHFAVVNLPQQQNLEAPGNYCICTYGKCKELCDTCRTYTMCCNKDCCTTPSDCVFV